MILEVSIKTFLKTEYKKVEKIAGSAKEVFLMRRKNNTILFNLTQAEGKITPSLWFGFIFTIVKKRVCIGFSIGKDANSFVRPMNF